MLVLLSVAQAARVCPVLEGNCTHTDLGQAVIDADPGDTIRIEGGFYPAAITLDKPLMLRGAGASPLLEGPLHITSDVTLLDLSLVGGPTSSAVVVDAGATVNAINTVVLPGALPPTTGGGMTIRGTATLDLLVFEDLVATERGGALYVDGGEVTSAQSGFSEGFALEGGAVALLGGAVMDSRLDVFDSNTAGNSGGGLWVNRASLSMVDSILTGNGAIRGGAITTVGNTELTHLSVDEVSFVENLAVFEGGAIDLRGAEAVVDETDFLFNVAGFGGGAIHVDRGATLDLRVSNLCGNSTPDSGGAIFVGGSAGRSGTWRHNRFISNAAGREGGAITAEQAPRLVLENNHLLDNTSPVGAAILLFRTRLLLDSNLIAGQSGVAVVGQDAPVKARWNVLHDNKGDQALAELGAGNQLAAPELASTSVGGDCLDDQDWPTWSSPLRDAGHPDRTDSDGSRVDVGAYGGRSALGGAHRDPWADDDGDGFALQYDCDDEDASIFPTAEEEWYDGVDQNCDGHDDFDQDGDGFLPEDQGGEDCDDTDPMINPQGIDIANDGIDQNCDGAYPKDGDGDGVPQRGDCDDSNPEIFPNAEDRSTRVDVDCDGYTDLAANVSPRPCQTVAGGGWSGLLLVFLVVARRVSQFAHE